MHTQNSMNNNMEQRKRTTGKNKTTMKTAGSGSTNPDDKTGATENIIAASGRGEGSKSGLRVRARSGDDDCDGEEEEEEPVIQSAVMLRFGAEVPSLAAAGKCGRTAQFPIPDDWNDPEVST